MQADIESSAAAISERSAEYSGWAGIIAVISRNNDVSSDVWWRLGRDWERLKPRFADFKGPDRLFQATLCWEWWAVIQYRFSYWAHHRSLADVRRPLLRRIVFLQQAALLRFCYFTAKVVEGLSGARLNPLAEIGPGMLLMHTGSCGIGEGATIGSNFTMYQDANIVSGGDQGCPSLGDGVVLYSGARVIGSVHIGDNTRIGANAVVTHDLPPACIALGVPARPVAPGDRPNYAAALLLRDFVTTLVQDGKLEPLGDDRYFDKEGGEVITLQSARNSPSSLAPYPCDDDPYPR